MSEVSEIIVGILGGTGFDQDSSLLKNKTYVDLNETPFGRASDTKAISGEIEGVKVYIMARHGKDHDVNPSNVNYRANLWTLVKQLKCTHILATSACGSLKEQIKPGHVGILNQYVDRTVRGSQSFYKVCHVEQKNPINSTMQKFIEESCIEQSIEFHKGVTCVCIEGPRFSTLAESRMYRSLNFDVINMTSVPEVPLTAELATFYACIMLITDYDCWKEGEDSVQADRVVEMMKDLGAKARKIIPGVIRRIKDYSWSEQKACNDKKLRSAIMVA